MPAHYPLIPMSRRELGLLPALEQLRTRRLPRADAARKLRLSARQVRRKLRAYRRRGRRFRRARFTLSKVYPNLLLGACPSSPGQAWVSDFTRLPWRGRILYLATVLDLFTREIVGWNLQDRHATPLVLGALCSALLRCPRPGIFHSDNGREYDARVTRGFLTGLGIATSRSHPGCPRENGYQEAFSSQFKVELGDPDRVRSVGELVAEVHRMVYAYNTSRIHSALRMAPRVFRERYENRPLMRGPEVVENVSNVWGS